MSGAPPTTQHIDTPQAQTGDDATTSNPNSNHQRSMNPSSRAPPPLVSSSPHAGRSRSEEEANEHEEEGEAAALRQVTTPEKIVAVLPSHSPSSSDLATHSEETKDTQAAATATSAQGTQEDGHEQEKGETAAATTAEKKNVHHVTHVSPEKKKGEEGGDGGGGDGKNEEEADEKKKKKEKAEGEDGKSARKSHPTEFINDEAPSRSPRMILYSALLQSPRYLFLLIHLFFMFRLLMACYDTYGVPLLAEVDQHLGPFVPPPPAPPKSASGKKGGDALSATGTHLLVSLLLQNRLSVTLARLTVLTWWSVQSLGAGLYHALYYVFVTVLLRRGGGAGAHAASRSTFQAALHYVASLQPFQWVRPVTEHKATQWVITAVRTLGRSNRNNDTQNNDAALFSGRLVLNALHGFFFNVLSSLYQVGLPFLTPTGLVLAQLLHQATGVNLLQEVRQTQQLMAKQTSQAEKHKQVENFLLNTVWRKPAMVLSCFGLCYFLLMFLLTACQFIYCVGRFVSYLVWSAMWCASQAARGYRRRKATTTADEGQEAPSSASKASKEEGAEEAVATATATTTTTTTTTHAVKKKKKSGSSSSSTPVNQRLSYQLMSIYETLIYADGYHSLLRLCFCFCELMWFIQYSKFLLPPSPPARAVGMPVGDVAKKYNGTVTNNAGGSGGNNQNNNMKNNNNNNKNNNNNNNNAAKGKAGGGAGGSGGSGGGSAGGSGGARKPLAVASWWSPKMYMSFPVIDFQRLPTLLYSCLDPVFLFRTFPSSLTAVKCVLAVVAIIEVQRVFHALIGVRRLSARDGWEMCPLCGKRWRQSHRTALRVHRCRVLWPPAPAEEAAAAEEQQQEQQGEGQRPLPGDAFPDPNKVSSWARFTYSWLNPLLSTALCVPFGTFNAPSEVDKKRDAQAYWASLQEVTDRLPRLPKEMLTRESLDLPAWALWRHRGDTDAEFAAAAARDPYLPRRGRLEQLFLFVTKPARHVLGRAMQLFFLSSATRATAARKATPAAEVTTPRSPDRAAQADGKRSPPALQKRRSKKKRPQKKGLFSLFLQHPSGKEFVYTCVPLKLVQDMMSLIVPVIVRSLVAFLKEAGGTTDPSAYFMRGLSICGSLVLVVFLQVVFFQNYLAHLYASSVKATSTLKTLLLHHTLETPLAYNYKPPPTAATATAPAAEPAKASAPGAAGNGDAAAAAAAATTAAAATGTEKPPAASPSSPRADGSGAASPTGPSAPSAPKSATVLSHEGEAVSLLSIDAAACGDCLIFLHNVWGHPFVIVSSLFTMYSYVGLFATCSTFVTLIALIPFNRYSAGLVRTAQQQAKNNGARLSDLSSSLTSMRTVKAMSLEHCIMERTQAARKQETEGTAKIIRAEGFAAAHTELTTLFLTLVCVGSYLIAGGKMDASVLVPTMAALNVMRFPVWTLPHLFSQVTRGYGAMKRMESFLFGARREEGEDGEDEDGEDEEQSKATEARLNGLQVAAARQQANRAVTRGAITCDGCDFSWSASAAVAHMATRRRALQAASHSAQSMESMTSPMGDSFSTATRAATSSFLLASSDGGSPRDRTNAGRPPAALLSPNESESLHHHHQRHHHVLRNVSVNVAPGEFVMVQGSTGSGKSALLLAILGELCPTRATLAEEKEEGAAPDGFQVGGAVAYCAEIPWLRNRTIRENVRMRPDTAPETAEEKAWYDTVVRACGLASDLKALDLGDRTVVGEAGGKLSGGQKARVALARAVLRREETDIYLLDDILSALDVEVQKHIIANVFHGLLQQGERPKTIVLASHVAPLTVLPDRVLQLRSSGTLREMTSWVRPTLTDVEAQMNSWKRAANSPQRSHSVLSASLRSLSEAREFKRQRRKERLERQEQRRRASGGPPALQEAHKRHHQNEAMKTEAAAVAARRSVTFTLFPSKDDLYVLLIQCMGVKRLIMAVLTSILMQSFRSFTDNWLGIWFSLHREVYDDQTITGTTVHFAQKMLNRMLTYIQRSQPPPPPPASRNLFQRYFSSLDAVVMQFLMSYAAIGLLSAIVSYLHTTSFFMSYQRIANALQFQVVRRLFLAPVSYFDRVPSSGLLQILSRDQEVVDHALGESIQLIFSSSLQMLTVMFINTTQQPAFVVVVPICILLFYHLTLRFLLLSKQVRTLEGKTSARAVEVIKEAVSGAVTLRAYGLEFIEQLEGEMDRSLDSVHRASYVGLISDRWVGLRLEIVSLLLTSTLAMLSVIGVCFPAPVTLPKGSKVTIDRGAVAAGAAFAGMGVVTSMSASRAISMLCRRIGMFQNQYVSAEQLLRLYREVPLEGGPAEAGEGGTIGEVPKLPPPPPKAAARPRRPHVDADGNSERLPLQVGSLVPLDYFAARRLARVLPEVPPVLHVRHLSAKYQPHLPWVLDDISLTLQPGECVGLIGRSGNGKSTLFNALLQLMDVLKGQLGVPHVDPTGAITDSSIMVNALRLPFSAVRRLREGYFQLVSQEPLLLQGNIRSNMLLGIDGDEGERRFSDRQLWRSLQKVGLDELLLGPPQPTGLVDLSDAASETSSITAAPTADGSAPSVLAAQAPTQAPSFALSEEERAERLLSYPIQAQGTNISAGQRQLLCLARVLLRRPRVVLLDEVSSRVDHETDRRIQQIIVEEMLQRKPRPTEADNPATTITTATATTAASPSPSGPARSTTPRGRKSKRRQQAPDKQEHEEEDTEGPHTQVLTTVPSLEDASEASRPSATTGTNKSSDNVAASPLPMSPREGGEEHPHRSAGEASRDLESSVTTTSGRSSVSSASPTTSSTVTSTGTSSDGTSLTSSCASSLDEDSECSSTNSHEEDDADDHGDAAELKRRRKKKQQQLQGRAQRDPCAVLLIAHRLNTIMALCDRVLVIEKGTCIAELKQEEVSSLEDLESLL